MGWVFYALLTAVALASADLLVKLAAGRLSNSLAVLLYGSGTFLTGLIWVGWQRWRGIQQAWEPAGLLLAAGVGFAFSGVTLGLYATFGAGVPVSVGTPVIRLVGILIASLVGLLLLGEPYTGRYLIGLLLVCGGVYLIATR